MKVGLVPTFYFCLMAERLGNNTGYDDNASDYSVCVHCFSQKYVGYKGCKYRVGALQNSYGLWGYFDKNLVLN